MVEEDTRKVMSGSVVCQTKWVCYECPLQPALKINYGFTLAAELLFLNSVARSFMLYVEYHPNEVSPEPGWTRRATASRIRGN